MRLRLVTNISSRYNHLINSQHISTTSFIRRRFFHNASLTVQQQLSKLNVEYTNRDQNNPNLLLVQHLENLVRERGSILLYVSLGEHPQNLG